MDFFQNSAFFSSKMTSNVSSAHFFLESAGRRDRRQIADRRLNQLKRRLALLLFF